MREQRRQMRGSGVGGLVVATILVVAGLGIFFPSLPWQVFWGALLILLGVWVGLVWVRRNRRAGTSIHSQQG